MCKRQKVLIVVIHVYYICSTIPDTVTQGGLVESVSVSSASSWLRVRFLPLLFAWSLHVPGCVLILKCVCEREETSVCVRERVSKQVCVCERQETNVCVRERMSVCVCMREREG